MKYRIELNFIQFAIKKLNILKYLKQFILISTNNATKVKENIYLFLIF